MEFLLRMIAFFCVGNFCCWYFIVYKRRKPSANKFFTDNKVRESIMESAEREANKLIVKQKLNSNSQISIGGSNNTQISSGKNNCNLINIDGHVVITGNIKSLTVNNKKIEL